MSNRRGAPPRKGGSDIVALDVPRVNDAELVRVGVFRQMRQSYDRKTNKPKEGQEYEATMLSLYFDSGHPQRNESGDIIYDDDGEPMAHLINEGFVAITAGNLGNLAKILKALGFRGPRFYDDKGMTAEAYDNMLFELGTTSKGDDYSDALWGDLPLYPGKGPRGEFEVEVLSWKILGYEVIGRTCDIALTIDGSGYNKVESYMVSANFTGLDDAPDAPAKKPTPAPAKKPAPNGPPARQGPKPAGRSKDAVEAGEMIPGDPDEDPYNDPTPFDDEPTTNRAKYVTKAMKAAGVPAGERIALLKWMLEDEAADSIANISGDHATQFKTMIETGDGPVTGLRTFHTDWKVKARVAQADSGDSGDSGDSEDDGFGDDDFPAEEDLPF